MALGGTNEPVQQQTEQHDVVEDPEERDVAERIGFR
jgi:hypothetical protein